LQAFTPLTFGITLNEPAQCKIDFTAKSSFEEMSFLLGDSNLYKYNHTHQMNLPSPDSIEADGLTLGQGGLYDFFIRCRDKNGNENVDEFVVSFCVDDSPDTTPPIIVDTSLADQSPVAFGSDSIPFSLFTNEPAECRWSQTNAEFSVLENPMTCKTKVYEQNARNLYECATTLTGVKDRELTTYYFRCKDQPTKPENERNVNTQGYSLTVRGTQELTILETGPTGTIKDSTSVVPVTLTVETSNGANEGQAICYLSTTGDEGTYIAFFDTDSFTHSQQLSLPAGNYEYFFRCIDAGGNADEASTTFTVETDTNAPQITRAYKEGPDALKVVVNEPAECAYSLNNCNFVFDEGIKMIYSNPSVENVLFAQWQPTQTYYIKCRDEFTNQPSPNACSLVASATNIE